MYRLNFRAGVKGAVRLSIAWCLSEIIIWLIWPGAGTSSVMDLILAALGSAALTGLMCIPLCIISGLSFMFLAGQQPWSDRIRRYVDTIRTAVSAKIRSGRDLAGFAVAGLIFSAVIIALGYAWCLYCVSSMARAGFIALFSTIGIIFICAVCTVLCPLWLRPGFMLARAVPEKTRTLTTVIVLLLLSAAAVTAVFIYAHETIVHLPWKEAAFSGLLILITALLYLLKTIRIRVIVILERYVLTGSFVIISAAGVISSIRLSEYDTAVRMLVAEKSVLLPQAYRLVKKATDFDSDGYLSWWGEGDCNPHDGKVYPDADDPLGDGIDQDCSGKDGSLKGLDSGPGRMDYASGRPDSPCPLFLITLDAVSASELAVYGGKHMDLLSERAARGVIFDHAFSQGPSTRLSVPSIMTSKFDTQIARPMSHGQPAPISSINMTLAEVLEKNGYYTAAVVPVSYFNNYVGLYQGFRKINRSPVRKEKGKSGHTSRHVTEAAVSLIDTNAARDRFMLWVHYYDPHDPYTVEPGTQPVPEGSYEKYVHELAHVDRHLDDLLTHIEESYRNREHFILLTADHGEVFDKRSHKRKHHGFDLGTGVTRVPLVIWWRQNNARVTQAVSLLDVMPTFLNIASASFPGLEGDSLLPLVAGGKRKERPVFGQYYLNEARLKNREPLKDVSVRYDSSVLHYNLASKSYRLYDYVNDPLETQDLYRRSAETGNLLRVTIKDWLDRVRWPEKTTAGKTPLIKKASSRGRKKVSKKKHKKRNKKRRKSKKSRSRGKKAPVR